MWIAFCGAEAAIANCFDYPFVACFFRFAQYAFIRSDCALRLAGLRRFRLVAVCAGPVNATVNGFLGGLPRRLTGVPNASIARFSLSRSEIKSARICSVFISRNDTTAVRTPTLHAADLEIV